MDDVDRTFHTMSFHLSSMSRPHYCMYLCVAHDAPLHSKASTDARVYIDLFGSQGKLLDLYLRDATGETFTEGCEVRNDTTAANKFPGF